ncbi:IS21 family transposase [Yaniella halotolerans]|uniref:IS21 family transposase n=1 Tax=Yaniella halotolerans TaxID=225453 RepID=UPI0003B7646F|nr:IS21 family transposase [Yaniella halotolerans]
MVRKIQAKLVLELRAQGLSARAIAAAHGISRNSIAEVFDAVDRAYLDWDRIADLSEDEVYHLVFPGRGEHISVYAQPDWHAVHKELARVGVTLKLLHSEYVDEHALTGQPVMGYDRFCRVYQKYVLQAGITSRVGHKAGQTVEVDWSGPTMRLTDPHTGKTQKVYLFVACLPFSRYGFVEPTLDMQQNTWLAAHVAMFDFFGGSVPRIVCDNLKTGVTQRPKEGEIVLNAAYRELAGHYSAGVLPARIRSPKDKSSAENTVRHVATDVIAPLRNQTFHSLEQLRQAIRDRLVEYNQEPFQKRAGSRLSVFETEEQPTLRPLPVTAYEISEWVYGRRVARNGHITWAKNYYSVPYTQVVEKVDLRITATVVEIYRGSQRLGSHLRLPATVVHQYATHEADLPPGPGYQPWDQHRIRAWATRIGPSAETVIDRIFVSVAVAEQGFDPALAVLRLARRFSHPRLEAACALAPNSRVPSPRYAHLRPILESGQDKTGELTQPDAIDTAGYVRGGDYYAGDTK